MDTEINNQNNPGSKTKFIKLFIPFIFGGIIVFVMFTAYLYKVIIPGYETEFNNKAVVNQNTLENILNRKQTVNENSENRDQNNCPDQIFNRDNVKEFYSVKVVEETWLTFTSNKAGIKFDYPVGPDKLILFEFNEWPKRESDPSGIEFSWSTREPGTDYGNDYFAWGASGDLKIGRTSVDIFKWTEQNGKYFIHSAGGEIFEVEKILVKDTLFGTQALLYKSPCFTFCDDPVKRAPDQNNLIVNLPYNNREGIESVLFEIPDNFTNDDILRLVDSLKLIEL